MQIFLNVLFRRCHNQTHLWKGQIQMIFCSFPHRVEVSEVSGLTEAETADIPGALELLRVLYPLGTVSSQCSAQGIQVLTAQSLVIKESLFYYLAAAGGPCPNHAAPSLIILCILCTKSTS